ncbi:olfactory receptor 10A6-like [Amia ocellicauda]|uniref:olfactory receptor 10A6-like n=1 Tax=Amia ocellicauda TaxID=2972642 RepID=UPI003464AD74
MWWRTCCPDQSLFLTLLAQDTACYSRAPSALCSGAARDAPNSCNQLLNGAISLPHWTRSSHKYSSSQHSHCSPCRPAQLRDKDQESKTILSVVFLAVYLLTVLGNLLIVVVFAVNESLHTPMYILICNLAILDISLISITIPKMLAVFMFDSKFISFGACFTQMFFFMSLGITEGFLLTVMAYDRYLAIFHPLCYSTMMTNVLRLACAIIVINSILGLTIALSVLLIPLTLILLSNVKIVRLVLQISGTEGRAKAFSTCVSHLLVISVFFLTAIGVYISNRVPGTSAVLRVMAAVFQNVFPPLVNLIIFCLRTKEIRDSLVKTLKKSRVFPKYM